MAYRVPDFPHEARARLAKFLSERGVCASVEAASHVFGAKTMPDSLATALLEALTRGDERFIQDSVGDWTLRSAPSQGALRDGDFVVLDVETTGFQPPAHRITELGAVRIRGGQKQDEFCSLINPEREIPLDITRLTGISNSMVAGKPTALQLFPEFADWLGDSVIVAHNAPFDRGFVDTQWREVFGMPTGNRWLCSVRIARLLYPEFRSRSLGALCQQLGIAIGRAHRAGDDARATAEVFLRELDDLAARGVSDWETLDSLLTPTRKASARSRRFQIGPLEEV